MIAQIAQRRFDVPRVVVRVLDPARAAWYAEQGLHTICPTQHAIELVERAALDPAHESDLRMYVIIVGAGKVGWNLARELIAKDHEVTLIESERRRYLVVEQELEHAVQYGDATELWVLERAGIQRADLVIAVTGDDEDNMLICQVAKEKYLCERIIARVNNPRNLQHFKLLGIQPGGLRDRPDPAPDRARGAAATGSCTCSRSRSERLEIIELEVVAGAPAAGKRVDGRRAARRQPDHLGAARRRRLRAEVRHGHRGGRRGAAGPRPGPRGGDHAAVHA